MGTKTSGHCREVCERCPPSSKVREWSKETWVVVNPGVASTYFLTDTGVRIAEVSVNSRLLHRYESQIRLDYSWDFVSTKACGAIGNLKNVKFDENCY